jgi:hypothetical protein
METGGDELQDGENEEVEVAWESVFAVCDGEVDEGWEEQDV